MARPGTQSFSRRQIISWPCICPGGGSAFTFCMCPAAMSSAASSGLGGVVTNGMSYSGRGGENANAALLVTLQPEDFPGSGVLAGCQWQAAIEQRAFAYGGGNYFAPAQRLGRFPSNRRHSGQRCHADVPAPGVTWGDLRQVLPPKITDHPGPGHPLVRPAAARIRPARRSPDRAGDPQLLPGTHHPGPRTCRPALPGSTPAVRARLRRGHHVRRSRWHPLRRGADRPAAEIAGINSPRPGYAFAGRDAI